MLQLRYLFLLMLFFCSLISADAQSVKSSLFYPKKSDTLYVGIDNPFFLNAPDDTNRTKITLSNGSITGEGANRWVNPDEEGEIEIQLKIDSNTYLFRYRCLAVPNPEFVLGSGKTRVPVALFRQYKTCDVALRNFLFEVPFVLKDAIVYFAGPGFPAARVVKLVGNDLTPIADLLLQCVPGSVVTFDHIQVEGPDGIRVIRAKTFVLY